MAFGTITIMIEILKDDSNKHKHRNMAGIDGWSFEGNSILGTAVLRGYHTIPHLSLLTPKK